MDRTLTLTIKVVADTAKKALDSVKKNVDGVSKSADSVRKRFVAFGKGLVGLGKRAVKLATSLKALVAAFAALAIVQQITGYFTALSGSIDQVAKLSQELQVSVETISGLAQSAQFFGSSAEDVTRGIRKLNTQIGIAAQGSAELLKVFESAGIAIRDTEGNLRSTEDILFEVSDALNAAESSAEKAFIAARLFGEEAGPRMVNFLGQGEDALRGYIAEAEKFGILFSREQAAAVERLNDSLAKLGLALRGAFTQALLGIADQLSRRIDAITALILELGPAISKVLQDAFNSVSRFTEGAGNLFARLFSSEGRQELIAAFTSALDAIDERIAVFSANVRALAMATFDVIRFGLTDAFTDALANVTLKLKETDWPEKTEEEKTVVDIVKEAVGIAENLIKKSLENDLIGLKTDDLVEYVHMTADNLVTQLGFNPIFRASHPFEWMVAIGIPNRTNFFEQRVSEYSKLGSKSTLEFDTTAEF